MMKRFRIAKNQKGQMAIFVVLVFQVLFIFFALSLNVAMVVHDKINLQNSLDLATYYGAKKQAEVLNVMAHINFQMRQNWKLLAWRYRILGTLAQYRGYHKDIGQKKYWCPQNSNRTTDCSKPSNCERPPEGSYKNYCDTKYFICITHDMWIRRVDVDNAKNFCNLVSVYIQPVTRPNIPPYPMPDVAKAVNTGGDALIEKMNQSCPLEGSLNWLMAQLFMIHFRLDQKDRKIMMEEIYNKSLKEGKDLDGQKILDGAKKVFKQNLTRANYKSFEKNPNFLTHFNSFKDKEFTELFGKINVAPILQFAHAKKKEPIEGDCNQATQVHYKETSIGDPPSRHAYKFQEILKKRWPKIFIENEDRVNSLFNYNKSFEFKGDNPMNKLTLSFFKLFEKNKPKGILYYGLKVEFPYNTEYQIFSLMSKKIQFKATAFAKAFGGQFGPQPEQSDILIPAYGAVGLRNKTPRDLRNLGDYIQKAQPNYSRWPGDKWGLIDKDLHDNREKFVFLNKHSSYEKTKRVYNLEDYLSPLINDNIDDPLAINPRTKDRFAFTRMMELMAVYPDLYDITYYSIMANYHKTYFPKVCKLLKESDCLPRKENKFEAGATSAYIRGDFGWPYLDEYIKKNKEIRELEISIAPYFLKTSEDKINPNLLEPPNFPIANRGQTKPAQLIGNNDADTGKYPFPKTKGNLFYPWLARKLPDQLLSSWTNPKFLDYTKRYIVESEFLNCATPAKHGMPVPSACVGMGRSGYSVKMISCDRIKDFSPAPPAGFCP